MDFAPVKNVDGARLRDKLQSEVSSMGYDASAEMVESGFSLCAQKDTLPLDFVLGRQKRLVFDVHLCETEDGVRVTLTSRTVRPWDKIVAAVVGLLTFGVTWVTLLLSLREARNMKDVAAKTVQNVLDKTRNENGAE